MRNAFREGAKRLHPDRGGPEDAQRFRDLVEAYATLSDPEKRSSYDRRYGTPVRIRVRHDSAPRDHRTTRRRVETDGPVGAASSREGERPASRGVPDDGPPIGEAIRRPPAAPRGVHPEPLVTGAVWRYGPAARAWPGSVDDVEVPERAMRNRRLSRSLARVDIQPEPLLPPSARERLVVELDEFDDFVLALAARLL